LSEFKLKSRVLKSDKLTERRRSTYPPGSNDTWANYDSGVTTTREIQATQMTWSKGNPFPKGKGTKPVGGPFDTIRTDYRFGHEPSRLFTLTRMGYPNVSWEGQIFPAYPDVPNAFRKGATWEQLTQFVPSLGDNTLGVRGAKAISITAPTAPAASVSTTMAELYREGIPAMLGAQTLRGRTHLAKSAGGEYLNLQFGWLPLVSDVRKAAQAIVQSDTILRQLARDSGRNVRRRFVFPEEKDVSITYLDGFVSRPPPYLDINYWTNGSTTPSVSTTTSRRIWFEGAFTYYLDESFYNDSLRGTVDKARLLLGLDLNPDVMWNLMPWSWLIDWAVNIGPVLTNVSLFARDDLTLRYGYTMEQTIVTQQCYFPGLRPNVGVQGALPSSTYGTWEGVRKKRIEQSPFTLGLVNQALSLRQLAILSALGITRV
jgi:hypothetical protein